MSAKHLKDDLKALANEKKAAFVAGYFKTGKGQYGENDVFWGITVPLTRSVAKKHHNLPLSDIETLLADPVHEVRQAGLFILVSQFERGDDVARDALAKFYLSHLDGVNNWDLVDCSAPYILGSWLVGKDAKILSEFAASGDLWRQRIAVVATQALIRRGRFDETLMLADQLMAHPHDLIHKAVGWMLREVGNKDAATLRAFLDANAHRMPRTMLRYALEKFDEPTRKKYMTLKR